MCLDIFQGWGYRSTYSPMLSAVEQQLVAELDECAQAQVVAMSYIAEAAAAVEVEVAAGADAEVVENKMPDQQHQMPDCNEFAAWSS